MKQISLKTVAIVTLGIDFLAVASAILRAIILQRSPMRYFGENGYVTWVSIIQLLIIAVLCWKISNLRKNELSTSVSSPKKQPVIFWRISAIGMFFFALDEGLKIHENLDRSLHRLLQQEVTPLSSRLDDFIILFYAAAGLFIVYLFKEEFKNFVTAYYWFIWGLVFSFLTILLDMIGHDRETFAPFAENLQQLNDIHHWFSAVEEIPKILAGGAFIVALYHCLLVAKLLKSQLNPHFHSH